MNERIQELAEQAAKEKFGGVFGEMKLTMTFAEKFTELIVQECIDIAHSEGDNVAYLKDYFGVK